MATALAERRRSQYEGNHRHGLTLARGARYDNWALPYNFRAGGSR
jgi:hypothetical protein